MHNAPCGENSTLLGYQALYVILDVCVKSGLRFGHRPLLLHNFMLRLDPIQQCFIASSLHLANAIHVWQCLSTVSSTGQVCNEARRGHVRNPLKRESDDLKRDGKS